MVKRVPNIRITPEKAVERVHEHFIHLNLSLTHMYTTMHCKPAYNNRNNLHCVPHDEPSGAPEPSVSKRSKASLISCFCSSVNSSNSGIAWHGREKAWLERVNKAWHENQADIAELPGKNVLRLSLFKSLEMSC